MEQSVNSIINLERLDTATCISSECDVLLVCCSCKNLRYYGSSSEEYQRKSQFYDMPVEIIILSYAFKMRQDYLSTSYLDQKYLPRERSKTREIWMDPSNVCWDNLVSFWRHMMIFFSHLHYFTDEMSWKYEKTCQSGTWMSAPLICARATFSTRRLRASR